MFNRLLGSNTKENNEEYRIKLSKLFNTKEGKEVLAWLMRAHIFNAPKAENCNELQHAYNAGKTDFIRYLVQVADFDFNVFKGI
jgi:hypothetical protein